MLHFLPYERRTQHSSMQDVYRRYLPVDSELRRQNYLTLISTATDSSPFQLSVTLCFPVALSVFIFNFQCSCLPMNSPFFIAGTAIRISFFQYIINDC